MARAASLQPFSSKQVTEKDDNSIEKGAYNCSGRTIQYSGKPRTEQEH